MNLSHNGPVPSLWQRLARREGRFLLPLLPPLILALALGLRIYGATWDQGYLFHPDERSIIMRADCMYRVLATEPTYEDCTVRHYDGVFHQTVPGIPSPSVFLDAERSPLNPHWFPIGAINLYLLVGLRFLLSPLTHMSLEDMAVAGRALSALADVGSVALVYLLGKRLYGARVGLLAMALTALAVFHIQSSYFYRPETFIALLTLASFWFMLDVIQRRGWRDSALLGLMVGLVFAVKVTALPILLPLAITYGYRMRQAPRAGEGGKTWSRVRQVGAEALVMGLVTVATFLALAPYSLIDLSSFVNHNLWETKVVREPGLVPYTLYYVGMPWFWYEVRQLAVWGLGLPLGFAAWEGLIFALATNVRRPRVGDLLLLSWALLLFFSVAHFEVKFLRYIFPLTPVLILLGARSLFALLDWTKERRPSLAPAAVALIALVLAATAFYALAFATIYSRPHTAVQASEWMNANVPAGAIILTDNHWDEGFPNLGRYQVSQIPMYDGDTTNKMSELARDLSRAEYLISYSDRPYGSIARVSERYPLSSRYYRLLFSGELEYEVERAFTSYPQLLGVAFVDDTFSRPGLPVPEPLRGYRPAPLTLNLGQADQNLIDYDHPKVLLFRNVGRLSQDELLTRLLPSSTSARRPLGLMLSQEEAKAQQAGGTWSQLFQRDSFANRFPLLTWLFLIESIALVTLPLAFLLFSPLPDRGYLLAKPLGILLITYPPWLLASLKLLPSTRASIFLAVLLVAFLSFLVMRWRGAQVRQVLRNRWRTFLLEEGIFLAAFLAFYLVRLANPDLWHPFRGGEKPMDFAYLNAIIRSTFMPPYDPWFAGGAMNYYYWGHYLVATLIKASGILPQIAYNLAVPLFFALTFSLSFSLVYNLAAALRRDTGDRRAYHLNPVVAGLAAGFFVSVMANLNGALQLLHGAWKVLVQAEQFPAFDFWQASRAIPTLSPGECTPLGPRECQSITEFPFFTFLFADLHAHLIVIPFDLLALGLSLALVLGALRGIRWPQHAALVLLLALTVGALFAINTWDYPTYLLVGAGALLIAEYARARQLSAGVLRRSGLWALLLLGLGYLLYLPYHLRNQTFGVGIQGSDWQTPLYIYLAIHGVFVYLTITFLLDHASRHLLASELTDVPWRGRLTQALRTFPGILLLLAVVALPLVTVTLLALLGYGTVALLLALLILALLLSMRYLTAFHPSAPHLLFVLLLAGAAMALGIGVDVVRVKDDIDRMNTVFKFYLQAWVLLALVSAFFLGRIAFLWRPTRGWWRRLSKATWLAGLALLVLGSSAYVFLGSRARLADRFEVLPLSNDGMAFTEVATYGDQGQPFPLKWDAAAIRWLQENLQGSPVILEANTPYYRWGARVSVYTGLPTVLGWEWHQTQQRKDYGWALEERRNDVTTIYTTPLPGEALELLRRYQVSLVYVGPVERAYYSPGGLEKFERMVGSSVELIYPQDPASDPEVHIYRVIPSTPP